MVVVGRGWRHLVLLFKVVTGHHQIVVAASREVWGITKGVYVTGCFIIVLWGYRCNATAANIPRWCIKVEFLGGVIQVLLIRVGSLNHPDECLRTRTHLSTGAGRDLHGGDAPLVHLQQLLLLLGHDQTLLEHLVLPSQSRYLIFNLSAAPAVWTVQLILVG